MHVSFKPTLEKFINDEVQSGNFSSPDALIEAAVARLMLDRGDDEFDHATVDAIKRAEAEFDRGEDRPFSEAAAELRKKHLGTSNVK